MRVKRSLWIIIGLICVSLLAILLPICTAQHATISIKNVSVQLIHTREAIGQRVIHVYNIIAVLHNSGDGKSDEITVYFYDPEYNKTTTPLMKLTPLNASNTSLNPDENKTFILRNWPTPLSGDIPINISFGPASPNILVTPENSGYYVYTLSINGDKKTTSTPGFEIACILVAIMVLVMGRRTKK
jgi:hypothetical protein